MESRVSNVDGDEVYQATIETIGSLEFKALWRIHIVRWDN